MFIRIPYGTSYTATYRLRVWRPERCQSCGSPFAFAAAREAAGTSLDLLWLNPTKARERAQVQAEGAIRAAISSVKRTIPCPQCGEYSPQHIDTVRNRWRRLGILGGGVIVVAGLITLVVSRGSTYTYSLVALAVAVTWFGFWHASRIDFAAMARKQPARRREYRRLTEDEFRDLSAHGFAVAEEEPSKHCPNCSFTSMNDYATHCPQCGVLLVEYQ